MLTDLFSTTSTSSTITLAGFLVSLISSLALGIFISTVHIKTQKKLTSQSFALTLILLPGVISVIIMLVGTNIASAFSLAGAFSIIRFRSAPGDPKDIAYILFTLAVGLACGLGFIIYAVIVAVILCAAMIILEAVNYGKSVATSKILKITMPENLDYQNAFDDVMKEYTDSCHLNKIKTTELGSLYELDYSVATKNSKSEKAFIDDLRCRNGNLNITLVLAPRYSD